MDFVVCVQCYTYNHASYILDAMNGFTMQKTAFPYVCIIVDDASTDGEQEVISKYLNDYFDLLDKRVVRNEETDDYIMTFAQHRTNKNCFFAVYYLKYNHYRKKDKAQYFKGFSDNAKYIALCEGDDYWTDPLKLQTQVEIMQNNPNYSFCHTGFDYYYDGADLFQSGMSHTETNLKILDSKEDVKFCILDGNRYRVQTMTALFPSSLYYEVMKERPTNWSNFIMGDTPLWILLLGKGDVCFIDRKMAVYRIHDNSACRPNNTLNKLRFTLLSEEMRITIGEHILLEEDKKRILQKRYNTSLIHYISFDPNFKPIIEPHFTSIFEEKMFQARISLFGRLLTRLTLKVKKQIIGITKRIVL